MRRIRLPREFLKVQNLPLFLYRVLIACAAFVIYLPFARLDPDMLHDGIQYTSALGVAKGLAVHKDVFEQYGPLKTWIQAFTLKLFGETVLTLRYEIIFVIAAIAVLMFEICRKLTSRKNLGAAVALMWLLTTPAFTSYVGTYSLWPWPSLYSTLIELIIVTLLIDLVRFQESITKTSLWIGALASAIYFIRVQVGVFVWIGSLLVLYIGLRPNLKNRSSAIRSFFVSSLLFVSLIFSYLLSTDSLTAFYKQVFIGAQAYIKPIDFNYLQLYYFFSVVPFLAFYGIIVALARTGRFAKAIYPVGAIGSIILGLLIYERTWKKASFIVSNDRWRGYLDNLAESFIFAAFDLGLCAILFYGINVSRFSRKFGVNEKGVSKHSKVKSRIKEDLSNEKFAMAVPLIFVPASIIQLYPLADIYHLWWAAPVVLVWSACAISGLTQGKTVANAVVLLIIPGIISSLFVAKSVADIPRFKIQTGAMSGMEMPIAYETAYKKIDSVLSGVKPSSARFVCQDPMFAGWNGNYLSKDGNFAYWTWGGTYSAVDLTKGDRQFICSSTAFIMDYARQTHTLVKGPLIDYKLSGFTNGTFAELTVKK